MAAPVDIGTLIDRVPGMCGGKPKMAGTRLKVSWVAIWINQGWTPEMIIEHYPHLNLAQLHAALAYYYANREEIDSEIAEGEAVEAQWKQRLAK